MFKREYHVFVYIICYIAKTGLDLAYANEVFENQRPVIFIFEGLQTRTSHLKALFNGQTISDT